MVMLEFFFKSTPCRLDLSLSALLAVALFWRPLPGWCQEPISIECSEDGLRTALELGGAFRFDCGGVATTITLTGTLIISTDLTLEGTNQSVTISGGGTVPLFTVQPGVRFTLKNVTLADGKETGLDGTNGAAGGDATSGALFNNGGAVTLVNCRLTGHSAAAGTGANGVVRLNGSGGNGGNGGNAVGGAIYNNGDLLLTNCVFSGNTAAGGAAGNGADANASGNGSSGGGGGSGGAGYGGAIYNAAGGTLVAYDCTFASNRVSGASGGLGGNGSGLGSNGANGLPGGGYSGGIFNDGGVVTLLFSTFNGNSAISTNGGAGKANTFEGKGGDGTPGGVAGGGGVWNYNGTLTATNCTFFANSVTGGNGGAGGAGGSQGFGGNGGNGGAGGGGYGGSLFNSGTGSTLLVSCTLTFGKAKGGTGGAGGAAGSSFAHAGSTGADGASFGGNVANDTGTLSLKNAMMGYSKSTGGDGAGLITDGGYNLSSDTSVPLSATGSRTNVSLFLGTLGNNGGPTLTVPILSTNSPAWNNGNNDVGLPVDQRHLLRSGSRDIGAYEFSAADLAATLSIRLQTNQVLIVWPSTSTGYSLQSTPALWPASWTLVTNTPAQVGSEYVVTNTLASSNRFYRLIK